MFTQLKKEAIKYWEIRRIFYNIALGINSFIAWGISASLTYSIDDRLPASLTDPAVLLDFALMFVAANICYSLAYVAEFFLMSEKKGKFWPKPGRMILFILGCIIGILLAAQQTSFIEQQHARPIPLPANAI